MIRCVDGTREAELTAIARERISGDDPSHDFGHALRILKLAKRISSVEGGDQDVIIPAALFHDIIVHPKNTPQSARSSEDSAAPASEILGGFGWYPEEKIPHVARVIARRSFSKALPKESIEEVIVQDADLLESLGAIAVARTFCSSGQVHRPLYDIDDPKAARRTLEPRRFALDLFGARLFVAKERLVTDAARQIAESRERFLHVFFEQFIREIEAED